MYPILDEGGIPYAVCGISTDITEWKKMETALRENKNFTERILDTTPNIVYVFDILETRNIYINRQVEQILGYSPGEIQKIGNRVFDYLLHPDDREKVIESNRQLAARPPGAVVEVEYRMKTASGQWRWFQSRDTAFLRDEDGMLRQVLGAAADITERKLVREQLQQSNAKLRDVMMSMINAVSKLVEMRDPYTAGYQRHVSQLARASRSRLRSGSSASPTLSRPWDFHGPTGTILAWKMR